jgi:hypothetical protein
MSGSVFSFSFDQLVLPSTSENPSPSFTNKRQFDNAFYPSIPTTFDSTSPPTSSNQHPWINNHGGYSNNYRGGGHSRLPKRSRPYNYQN